MTVVMVVVAVMLIMFVVAGDTNHIDATKHRMRPSHDQNCQLRQHIKRCSIPLAIESCFPGQPQSFSLWRSIPSHTFHSCFFVNSLTRHLSFCFLTSQDSELPKGWELSWIILQLLPAFLPFARAGALRFVLAQPLESWEFGGAAESQACGGTVAEMVAPMIAIEWKIPSGKLT